MPSGNLESRGFQGGAEIPIAGRDKGARDGNGTRCAVANTTQSQVEGAADLAATPPISLDHHRTGSKNATVAVVESGAIVEARTQVTIADGVGPWLVGIELDLQLTVPSVGKAIAKNNFRGRLRYRSPGGRQIVFGENGGVETARCLDGGDLFIVLHTTTRDCKANPIILIGGGAHLGRRLTLTGTIRGRHHKVVRDVVHKSINLDPRKHILDRRSCDTRTGSL